MARPQRSERNWYDIESITDIALQVFRRKGFEATSVVDIAAAAGLTKSSLYHHVSGKEELLARGLERALKSLFGVLGEGKASSGTAVERLDYILGRAIEVEIDFLPEVSVLLRARGNTEIERNALSKRREFDAIITALVAEGQVAGDIRYDIEAAVLTRLVFGMANWLTEWYRPEGPISREETVAAIRKVVFEGIGSSRERLGS